MPPIGFPRRNIGIAAHGSADRRGSRTRARVGAGRPDVGDLFAAGAGRHRARLLARRAVNTILPQLLAPAEFANANAWLASTYQLASIIGPAAGGLLIAATGGATAAFAAAAVGQAVFVVMLRTMPVRTPAPATGKRSRAGRVRRLPLRAREPVVPRRHHARSVRGVVRRRGGAAADLRERHPAGRPRGSRLAARRAGPRRHDHGARHHEDASRGRVRAWRCCGWWPGLAWR